MVGFNIHGSVHRKNILTYIQQDTNYTVYFSWKLLYMFRMVPPAIIRSANNCIYSIWYLSHRYCYLPLSWKSWNWFECAMHFQTSSNSTVMHSQTSSNSSTIAVGSSNGVTNTRCCRQLFARLMMMIIPPPETCRAVSR